MSKKFQNPITYERGNRRKLYIKEWLESLDTEELQKELAKKPKAFMNNYNYSSWDKERDAEREMIEIKQPTRLPKKKG